MVHSYAVHLPLGAQLIWATMCGAGCDPTPKVVLGDEAASDDQQLDASLRSLSLSPAAARTAPLAPGVSGAEQWLSGMPAAHALARCVSLVRLDLGWLAELVCDSHIS